MSAWNGHVPNRWEDEYDATSQKLMLIIFTLHALPDTV